MRCARSTRAADAEQVSSRAAARDVTSRGKKSVNPIPIKPVTINSFDIRPARILGAVACTHWSRSGKDVQKVYNLSSVTRLTSGAQSAAEIAESNRSDNKKIAEERKHVAQASEPANRHGHGRLSERYRECRNFRNGKSYSDWITQLSRSLRIRGGLLNLTCLIQTRGCRGNSHD